MLVFLAQKLNYNSDIQVTYALPDLLCRLLDMEEGEGCGGKTMMGIIAKMSQIRCLSFRWGNSTNSFSVMRSEIRVQVIT